MLGGYVCRCLSKSIQAHELRVDVGTEGQTTLGDELKEDVDNLSIGCAK
jgi:hypothetical protein